MLIIWILITNTVNNSTSCAPRPVLRALHTVSRVSAQLCGLAPITHFQLRLVSILEVDCFIIITLIGFPAPWIWIFSYLSFWLTGLHFAVMENVLPCFFVIYSLCIRENPLFHMIVCSSGINFIYPQTLKCRELEKYQIRNFLCENMPEYSMHTSAHTLTMDFRLLFMHFYFPLIVLGKEKNNSSYFFPLF